jgi:hypothetical protein
MKQHPEIVNELQDIAPTLASLQGRGCPFVVPVGEKKDFEKVDWQKLAEQKEYEAILGNKAGTWAVPENYWKTLSQDIFNNTTKEVPQELAIAEISKIGGFTTPANFFDRLNDEIFSKIEGEVIAIQKTQAFRTPEAYFEGLEAEILNKITAEKVIVRRRTLLVNWRSTAVAAVLAGVIFSAVWFLKLNNTSLGVETVAATAMNEQQLQEYVQEQASEADIQNMVEANELETAQEEELQQLVSEPEEKTSENKKAVLEEYISNEIDESTLTELL